MSRHPTRALAPLTHSSPLTAVMLIECHNVNDGTFMHSTSPRRLANIPLLSFLEQFVMPLYEPLESGLVISHLHSYSVLRPSTHVLVAHLLPPSTPFS